MFEGVGHPAAQRNSFSSSQPLLQSLRSEILLAYLNTMSTVGTTKLFFDGYKMQIFLADEAKNPIFRAFFTFLHIFGENQSHKINRDFVENI